MFPQQLNHPVCYISWNDAVAFIAWLNRSEKTNRYRLPTEAEWEYSCRAGTTTPFYWGTKPDGGYANFGDRRYAVNHPKDEYVNWGVDDGHAYTAPVASYRANAFGLYDMSGNIYEWCNDWYADHYDSGAAIDPRGPTTGKKRVVRGGSWSNFARLVRAARRNGRTPDFRSHDSGFRLARTF